MFSCVYVVYTEATAGNNRRIKISVKEKNKNINKDIKKNIKKDFFLPSDVQDDDGSCLCQASMINENVS